MTSDKLYFQHILQAVKKIKKYTSEGSTEFLGNTEKQDAVIRNFEIIGEAAKLISAEMRERFPDIDYSGFARFRDRLSHGYFSVNLEIVWDTIENDIPTLHTHVEQILAQFD